jgi:hypothetical protein
MLQFGQLSNFLNTPSNKAYVVSLMVWFTGKDGNIFFFLSQKFLKRKRNSTKTKNKEEARVDDDGGPHA